MKQDLTPGRMCAACGTVQPRHNLFYIVPGVKKSICSACVRLGFVFSPEGRVVKGSHVALQAALDARKGKEEA
jgi:hypothetical protein